MLQLRPYQQQAFDAVMSYWQAGGENPLVEMATGTGKALFLAKICQSLLADYPDMRIVQCVHIRELVEQNFLELLEIWPFAPAGILSAGLGRRDTNSQILFASVQTAYTKADRVGHVDLVLVDECHLLGQKSASMYGQFLGRLAEINPDMKVLGTTATPFRMDSGLLTDGSVRMFDDIVYKYGIAEGIADGWLSPLVSKATDTGYDLTGVRTIAGDYKRSDLAAAVDKYEKTRAAVAEVVAFGQSRKTWLTFCSGIEHAEHVRDEFRSHGVTCEMVTGNTPSAERRKIIQDYKAGLIRCITNDMVMSTGTNVPSIDLIADMAPTKSAGRYVQRAGRGTRPVYPPGFNANNATIEERVAAIKGGPKPSCLYLDFAGTVRYHGPVDLVQPRKPGKGDGEAPVKICPNCQSLVHASKMVCDDCGFEFEAKAEEKIERRAASLPILSNKIVTPEWVDVRSRTFKYHEKPGGVDSVRTEYMQTNFVMQRDWICIQHTGYPRERAQKFWREHRGNMPYPKTVDEFLDRQAELAQTKQIQIKPDGKYWKIVGTRPAKQGETLSRELDLSDIPF